MIRELLKYREGFTLIELAIVFVIIGLVAGGILAGDELIRAANLRRIMNQMESYNTAVQVFRSKYNQHPGDGRDVSSFLPGAVNGNGDARLQCNNTGVESDDTGLSLCTFAYEYATFWSHLGDASLIGGKYNGSSTVGAGFPSTADHRGIIAYYQPSSGASAAEHRFAIGARQRLQGVLNNPTTGLIPTFSYLDAGTMDRKWDDGNPQRGRITAFGIYTHDCSPPAPGCTQTDYMAPSSYDAANQGLLRLYFTMSAW